MPKGRNAVDLKRIRIEFGEQLRRLLERRHWKQEAFAKHIQMDPSYLSKILTGQVNLTVHTIRKVLDGLNVATLSEFYEVRERTVAEVRYADEFKSFRQLLVETDSEGLRDLQKCLRRIIVEVRERDSPGQHPQAG